MKKWFYLIVFCAASLSTFSQEWELLTPVNSEDIVRNCSFSDALNGAAVIQAEGVVLLTDDGGITWSRPWTPGISTNLYDVERIGLDSIYTCGTSGEIFRSIDGGTSWNEMSTPTNEYLYALEFISAETGFACGFNGTLLKTSDGGTTWVAIDLGTTDRFYDIEFPSATVGYICTNNGIIHKTIDQGETWIAIETGFDGALLNLTSPSESHVYACGWNQTIVGSLDGGDSFAVQNTGNNNQLNFIEFKDELNGWAAGDWGGYFSTSNGGATWASSDASANEFIWCGQYIDESTSFLMGKGIMLKSENGASSWGILKNSVPRATYNGVYFFDDERGYAAGAVGGFGDASNRSGVVYTENGGQTWETQYQGFSGGWYDIHFVDENFGTAIGGGNFLKTTNGGQNWINSTLPISLTGTSTWWFSPSEGLVGGDGLLNGICKTNDSGTSYNCQENMSAGDFYFVNEEVGYAVMDGSTENIFKTLDGGETWDYIPTGNFQSKHSVFFLNENTGWVGAGSGSVLRTTDGGMNWQQAFIGYDVVGIKFYSPSVGFCVDNQGNVFKSLDGGANWEMFLPGLDYNMPSAREGYFTDNYLYLGTQSGDIYKCELGCVALAEPELTFREEWCTGEPFELSYQASGLVQEYNWSFPSGWSAEEFGDNILVTAGSEGGFIGLELINNCGISSYAEKQVGIFNTSAPEVEYGATGSFCVGSELELIITDAQEEEEFFWNYPEVWPAIQDGNNLSLELESGQGWFSVIRVNDCSATVPYYSEFMTNEAPDVSFMLPEESAICDNEELILEGGFPLGGTYSGDFVENGLLNVNGSDAEETEVFYTFTAENGCSSSRSDTIAIRSGEIIGGNWVINYPPCGGDLLIGVTGAENFDDWVTTPFPDSWGNVIQFSGGDPLYSAGNVYESTQVIITLTNECGTEKVFTTDIEILETPEIPSVNNDAFSWCVNSAAVIEISSPDSLVWSADGLEGNLISMGAEDYLLDLNGEIGTYELTLSAENECGVSLDTLFMLQVNALPEVSLSLGADTLCLEEIISPALMPSGGVLSGDGVSGIDVFTSFLNPNEPYTYLYTYTDANGCTSSAESTHYYEVCNGVDELVFNSLKAYPNPVVDKIHLNFRDLYHQDLIIWDAKGSAVAAYEVDSLYLTLDVASLPAGEYYIQYGESSVRFIKN